MKYTSIPIPNFNFSEVPEQEAEEICGIFFISDFNIGYQIEVAREYIQNKLFEQASSDDKIIILSYLINKLTHKIYNLPAPKNDFQKSLQDREAKHIYKTILHWLYRLIANEGVEIPSDLFSNEEYYSAIQLLEDISGYLEGLKNDYPDKSELITEAQTKIVENKKFIWLGKKKYVELLIGALFKIALDKALNFAFKHIMSLISSIHTFLIN